MIEHTHDKELDDKIECVLLAAQRIFIGNNPEDPGCYDGMLADAITEFEKLSKELIAFYDRKYPL